MVAVMDLTTVVILSAFLLVTAEPNQTRPETNVIEASSDPPADADAPTSTSSSSSLAPPLGVFTVEWTSECEGDVNLILRRLSNSSSPVCHGSEENVQSLLRLVCQTKKGCDGAPVWHKGRDTLSGYHITDRGAVTGGRCEILRVQCPGRQVQLQIYKVVTVLLSCMLLVLLLIRFSKPTIKSLQKRLSDRRQNRWIGPTQSHSVSYHRGKLPTKTNDGENRLSYPALERLVVSDSREPSSNRNSGSNF